MYSTTECLLLFIYEDEILLDELPEGHRAYAALKLDHLKDLGMVTVTYLPGTTNPLGASLTDKALRMMPEFRAR